MGDILSESAEIRVGHVESKTKMFPDEQHITIKPQKGWRIANVDSAVMGSASVNVTLVREECT